MRVIQTVAAISEEASGPSYSVVRLTESLYEAGIAVQLATLDWSAQSVELPFLKRFPLSFGPRRLGRSVPMKRWLENQPGNSVFHTHGLWMMPNVYPGHAARRTHSHLVVSPRGTLSPWALEHGSFVKKIFWPVVQHPAISSAACFHATAVSESNEIREAGFRQPIAVIPNGVDIPAMRPRNPGRRTVLFMGRIHRKKGLDMLLTAWSRLERRHGDWALKIVGPDDGHLGEMRALASAYGLKRVEFHGELRGQEKWAAYFDAELFVLPTHSENFGMVVAEALASGMPVVVTKGAPWPELMERNAGWWTDISVDALEAAIADALARPVEALAAMGQAGRIWMREKFGWPRIAAMTSETYKWIHQGGTCPPWVRVE